jgi:protease I
MKDVLHGRKVAFIVANSGVEQIELTTPWNAVQHAGGQPVLIAPEAGEVQAFHNDVEPGDTFFARIPADDVNLDVDDYVGLVLPGGTTNADRLRTQRPAVRLIAAFAAAGKPIAAICHAPWTLIEAQLVRDRTLTSWPSLRTDITNAGGHWLDETLVVCTNGPFTLVTSRGPADLAAFVPAANAQFGAHDVSIKVFPVPDGSVPDNLGARRHR